MAPYLLISLTKHTGCKQSCPPSEGPLYPNTAEDVVQRFIFLISSVIARESWEEPISRLSERSEEI